MAGQNDPVADDIANRNPDTDDQVAGEEVLADEDSAGGETADGEQEETDRDRLERHD